MKMHLTFDATVSSYEVKSNLYMISGIDGVSSVQLYEKASGEAPRYCVEMEVADDRIENVEKKIASIQSEFAGYISNMKQVAYKPV
jgi:hypothetical protein